MAGKIHSGGTVHFRLPGDRRVVRRDGAKTLTVDRRPCAARLQRSLFPADRLARAPGRRTPLAVRPLPPGRARPGRQYRTGGELGYGRYGEQVDLEVIKDMMMRENNDFPIEELNT